MLLFIYSQNPCNAFMKALKYIICLGLLLVLCGQKMAAQEEEEALTVRDKIFFGGNFGLQIGTITNVEVSPIVGYNVTPKFAAGVGLRYEFLKNSSKNFGYLPYETNIYGGSVFTRYMLFKNTGEQLNLGIINSIFAHAEYEFLSLERKYFEYPPSSEEGRFLAHSVLVGGGLFQPMGRRGGFLMMLLWNLNETASSPYSNPIIRIGFVF
jgi:hypothetical protein